MSDLHRFHTALRSIELVTRDGALYANAAINAVAREALAGDAKPEVCHCAQWWENGKLETRGASECPIHGRAVPAEAAHRIPEANDRADLLREVREWIAPMARGDDGLLAASDLLARIDAVLAGKCPRCAGSGTEVRHNPDGTRSLCWCSVCTQPPPAPATEGKPKRAWCKDGGDMHLCFNDYDVDECEYCGKRFPADAWNDDEPGIQGHTDQPSGAL